MPEASARLPASEVLRFGGLLFARIVIAVVFGLTVMKVGQWIAQWPAARAIVIGQVAAGLFLGISFYVRKIAWPEVDYGPDREQSLLDEEKPSAES